LLSTCIPQVLEAALWIGNARMLLQDGGDHCWSAGGEAPGDGGERGEGSSCSERWHPWSPGPAHVDAGLLAAR